MRLLVLAVLALGCKSREAPLRLDIDPVSEADAKAFAEKLVPLVKPCDDKKLAPLVDGRWMAAKFAANSKIPNVEPAARELSKSLIGSRLLCTWMRGVQEYKLLRVRMSGNEPRPIMRRLIKDPRGMTVVGYDELQLGTSKKDRQVRLADAFSYVQGQWLSEMLGGNLEAFAQQVDMMGDIPKMAQEVRQARDLWRNGRAQEALAMIDKLPTDVRQYRAVQLLRVRVASAVSNEAYKQALEQLEEVFPSDASIAMVQMDGAFVRGDNNAALRWIDMIDKAIGGDSYLEANRALAYLRAGNLDKAAERIDAAIKAEPGLTRAWEIKLEVVLAQKRWADAVAVLDELEAKHGLHFEEEKMRASPALVEFSKSTEFKDWLAKRK